MRGWLAIIVGLVLVAMGALWTAQGLGYIGGSVMSGKPAWAVIGPVVAVIGVILVAVGARRARRSRT
jgi:hypothetical protein